MDLPDRFDESSQKACEQLAVLIRWLVETLHKFQNVQTDVLSSSDTAHQLLEELKIQLHQARNLVEKSYGMPWMYRIINAFQIRSEFRGVCQDLGHTLEGLHSLLSPEMVEMKEGFRQLELAFRNSTFHLDSVELQIYKEARNISSEIYKSTITLSNGVLGLRNMLENTFGVDKVERQWKQVAIHLFRDIDAARRKNNRTEEHYLRRLLWAMSGNSAPPEFYCPISLDIMEEPVILFQTEVTYDRRSIEAWLSSHGYDTCPVSGENLREFLLVENRPLRNLIEEWKRGRNFPVEEMRSHMSSRDVENHWESQQAISIDVNPNSNANEPSGLRKTTRHPVNSPSHQDTNMNSTTRKRLKDKERIIELMTAAQDGDLVLIQEYGEGGCDLGQFDEGGRTCLHVAAAFGKFQIVEYLIGKDVNIDSRTQNDEASPLYLAALGGYVDIAQLLIDSGASIMAANKDGWTPLHAAADQGHPRVALILLEDSRKYSLECAESQSVSGWTALHHAARRGCIETMRQMLPFYETVNLKCEVYHLAVYVSDLAADLGLLSAGWTPLHVAVDNGHAEIVELLLEHNANPSLQSKDGWTSLHAAQDKNFVEIGRLLLMNGADADIQSAEGVTALHRAAFLNQLDFAQLLVSNTGQADIQKKTKAGRKAIDIANDQGNQEMYRFLYKRTFKKFKWG